MARNKTSIEEKYNAPFPTALRVLMEERGETQESIAKAAGKTRQTISQYVNGISEPGYDVLVKIADYFDVSIDYLLGRTGDPTRLPCAVDELGLSVTAISTIKHFSDRGCSDSLDGLNTLIENGRFISLAGEITHLRDMISDFLKVSSFYKVVEGNLDSYYKLKLAHNESALVSEMEKTIEAVYPGFKGAYKIMAGSSLVEYQKQVILEIFDEILRQVSNYSEFRSNTLKAEDILT